MRGLRMLIVALVVAAAPAFADPFDDGVAAHNRRDYATALKLFRPLATKGDSDAQFNIGLMHAKGQGVPKDDQQALFWYRKAAEQGHAGAQLNLGVMYANGQGVPKNYQQAYFWWLLSSVGGDADSIENRDLVESRITPQQRAAAQAEARNWKPRGR